MSNPYGIMNQSRYNYFSHLRTIMQGDSKYDITTSKRLTLEQYQFLAGKVFEAMVNLKSEIEAQSASFSHGTGMNGIVGQIGLDNLYLKLNAHNGNSYDDRIVWGFTHGNRNAPSASLSFAKIIEYGVAGYANYMSPDVRREVDRLKSTFNEPYLSLSNRHM
jgi:hypothetical protein